MTPHRRIGVVSIARSIPAPQTIAFEHVYNGIGKNTGNFMFTEAMFRVIAGEVRRIGFAFDPAEVNATCDAVVVPAANWLNAGADWDWLTDLLARLEVPVITFGIGLQAETRDLSAVRVSASALRLAQVLSAKAPLMSARGDFTRDWLRSVGIGNVVTTGCPSLYMRIADAPGHAPDGPLVLQSTRYGITAGFNAGGTVNRHLFALAPRIGAEMLFQSEIEEMNWLLYRAWPGGRDDPAGPLLADCYGLPDVTALADYLAAHGRVFFDLADWSGYLRGTRAVIGTRLHGAILALNSGVPALLVAHDSRTAEIADFAAIPTAPASDVIAGLAGGQGAALVRPEAVAGFAERRGANRQAFLAFLYENGLAPDPAGLI